MIGRIQFLVLLTVLSACGSGLTDDQRKRVKEEMETQRIKRVSEAEITEAAFSRGRDILTQIALPGNLTRDSIFTFQDETIRYVTVTSQEMSPIERQLMEAYIEAEAAGDLQDNIQKIHSTDGVSDSILFTRPAVRSASDGNQHINGMWSIYLSQKRLILSMKDK